MERVRKQQLLEQSIYGVIWSVIFFLPLIGEYFAVRVDLRKKKFARLYVTPVGNSSFFYAFSVE